MATIFRPRPWRKPLARRRFVPATGAFVTETIDVVNFALTITPQNVTEADSTIITHQALTLTGQAVAESENELVGNAALTMTFQTVLENEATPVTETDLLFTGGTVNLIDSEATAVDKDDLVFTGQDITPSDLDAVSIVNATLTIAQQDIGSIEIIPQGGVMAGGGGSGSGPASDAAYYARQKYEQDKRDKEQALWKGKPATVAADGDGKPAAAPAKAKTAVTPPEPFGPDLDALFAELLAPSEFTFTPPPRPARVFDPEDDVAVLLLTDL